jgi:hypothetical protein
MFERAKTVRSLDRVATVIGPITIHGSEIVALRRLIVVDKGDEFTPPTKYSLIIIRALSFRILYKITAEVIKKKTPWP